MVAMPDPNGISLYLRNEKKGILGGLMPGNRRENLGPGTHRWTCLKELQKNLGDQSPRTMAERQSHKECLCQLMEDFENRRQRDSERGAEESATQDGQCRLVQCVNSSKSTAVHRK